MTTIELEKDMKIVGDVAVVDDENRFGRVAGFTIVSRTFINSQRQQYVLFCENFSLSQSRDLNNNKNK